MNRAAECLAILGGDPADPLRMAWIGAGERDRLFMVKMAGLHASYSRVEWDKLSASTRGMIRDALRRFKAWAEKAGV